MTQRIGTTYEDARRRSPETPADRSEPHIEQIEASVAANSAEEVSKELSPLPLRHSIEESNLERGLAWVELDCDQLDHIPLADIKHFIDQRNAGRADGVPQFLLTALENIEGPVESLVKVRYPANVKEGEKVAFKHRGLQVKVRAKKGNFGGTSAILAVYVKKKERIDVSGLTAFTAVAAKRISDSFKTKKKRPETPADRSEPHIEQIEASVAANSAEEVSKELSPLPLRHSIEESNLERGLAWVELDCDQLDHIPLADIKHFIDQRNAGRADGVPQFLLTALENIEGPVESLVKVRYPANVKEGEKLAFKHGGLQVKVRAKKGNFGGMSAILAVYVKKKERIDVSGLTAFTAVAAKRISDSFKTKQNGQNW